MHSFTIGIREPQSCRVLVKFAYQETSVGTRHYFAGTQ